MRRKKYYEFQQVLADGQMRPTLIDIDQPPSAFMAAVSVSGSVLIAGGVFSLSYRWDYFNLLPLAAVPWVVYGLGKSAYLVALLVSDIISLFEATPEPQIAGRAASTMLPIVKEEL